MKKFFYLSCLAAMIVSFGICEAAQADDWGTLKGRFVYDGKAPKPANITVNKEPEVCGKHPLYDESLVVDDNGGIANVFIWARTKDLKVAPTYAATANDKAVLDNHDCRFEPHALAIRHHADARRQEHRSDGPQHERGRLEIERAVQWHHPFGKGRRT